ncbi:D-alanyl-D-alanine carboxypeptidase [Streptomyces sp. AM6-12]|uniref:D-alanyl-D-alanine carboxypeptidase n=1 Tax=Streptomyces sp. AM6-12 TaxID=3345149 RepID=UPI003793241A
MVRTGRARRRAGYEEASVAGESPDRSKQRESSAGAMSGNADSVPEAPDPRVAVSRGAGSGAGTGGGAGQKDSSNGGTDTATKVFRTPAVEEDTDLRNAVSAWVRDADAPEASTDAPAKDAEGSGGTTETGAGGDASAAIGEGADAEVTADGNDAEADAGSDAEDDSGPAEAKSAGTDGSGSETGAGAKSSTGDTKTEGERKSPQADSTVAKSPAGTKAAGGSKPGATAKNGSGGKAGAEAKAGSRAEASKADAATDADEKNPADDTAAATRTKADSETTEAKTGTGAKTGAQAEASKADADTDADKKNPARDATAGAARAKADAETADAEAEALADDAAAKAGTKTVAGAKADAGTKADARPKTPAVADAKTGAKPKTEAETGKAGKTEAGKDADGVDQPTTVFKAVRPGDPQVDQPTTMLKVGQGKRDETDAERTSKFVALKDDVRSKPKPAPAEETTAVPQVGPERTTQQPLPPKPPLDLLAELTNTPPPPETPVRTALRRVKIWTPLVLLLVIIFAVVQTLRPLPSPTLALTAKDTYTFGGGPVSLPWPGEGQGWMDGDGIGTMGNFGKQTPVAIGSVAKTMTAYIILRDHPLKPGQEGQRIKVDATAEKEGGYNKSGESTLNTVHAGDTLTEKQALSAVMIPSANNIARLLARWDAGSEAAFVKKMNATAKQLGMTGTTYTDPSGLKETTVSTAHDQVRLGRAVVKIPALVAITSAASWTDPTGQNWPNYNSLPYWIGAIGIKTGTTTAAGGNLLFAARQKVGGQTVTVVGAILGQHKPSILDTVNQVSKTALLGAEHALTSAKILKKGDVVGYVDDQLGGKTPIVVTQDVTAVGWSGLKVKLSFASDPVPHTAKAGTRVGTLTVGDGTTAGVQVPVALQRDLAEPGFGAKLTRIG